MRWYLCIRGWSGLLSEVEKPVFMAAVERGSNIEQAVKLQPQRKMNNGERKSFRSRSHERARRGSGEDEEENRMTDILYKMVNSFLGRIYVKTA